MKVWNFVDAAQDDADLPMRDRENPPNVYGFGHAAYLERVVDTVLNDSPSLVDGLEAASRLN
jgi:UDP-N-acetyl-2-amino-2-deoxyglucuronate dehydrogenase